MTLLLHLNPEIITCEPRNTHFIWKLFKNRILRRLGWSEESDETVEYCRVLLALCNGHRASGYLLNIWHCESFLVNLSLHLSVFRKDWYCQFESLHRNFSSGTPFGGLFEWAKENVRAAPNKWEVWDLKQFKSLELKSSSFFRDDRLNRKTFLSLNFVL